MFGEDLALGWLLVIDTFLKSQLGINNICFILRGFALVGSDTTLASHSTSRGPVGGWFMLVDFFSLA
jgi:purine-cytosine permease-like protein